MSIDLNESAANSAVSTIYSAAQRQANNAKSFANAIEELNGYFQGAVASKFMQQAANHSSDLANVASNIVEIGSGLNSITKRAVQNAEEVGRGGNG